MLVGTFLLGYGFSRFIVEMFRQPDAGLENLSWGLTMGQTLTVPMIAGGAYLIIRAARIGAQPVELTDPGLAAEKRNRVRSARTTSAAPPWPLGDKR